MSLVSKIPKPKLPKLKKVEAKTEATVEEAVNAGKYTLDQFAADVRAFQKGTLNLEDFFKKTQQ